VIWPVRLTGDLFARAYMMRIWPPDIDTGLQAAALALDYVRPFPLKLSAGRWVKTDDGDFDHDGFNESRGHYVLQLEGDVGLLEIDGSRNIRFGPVFKIIDVAGRDVWVYLDGRLIDETYRDLDKNLIVCLPDISGRKALVEIHARERETSSPEGDPEEHDE